MKTFIHKMLIFAIGLILFSIVSFTAIQAFLNRPYNNDEAIFIWGDSQAYQGIDMVKLSNSTHRKVYSSAHHGAGIYDFLVFVDQVPEESHVLVALSKLVQVRRKERDYNKSGLSMWALKMLYKNGYSLNESFEIFKQNITPKSNILESTVLYPYADTMEVVLPLSHFESYYKSVPTLLHEKQDLYIIGIERLIEKNCNLSFLEFPFHPDLQAVEDNSPIKALTEKLKNSVSLLFPNFKEVTLVVNKSKNVFKDLSHFNSIGAKDLSGQLGEHIKGQKVTTLYISQ